MAKAELIKVLLSLHLMLTGVLFVIPTSYSDLFYLQCLGCAFVLQLISLYQRHGFGFSLDYAGRIFRDDRFYNAGHALIVWLTVSKPFLLCVVPHVIRATIFACRYGDTYWNAVAPGLGAMVAPYVMQVRQNELHLLIYGAVFEAYTGFILIFYFFMGASSFISIVVYWQYIQGKYSVSNNLKVAFTQIRLSLEKIFHHSYCPGIVSRGFDWVVLKLWGFANPAPPAAAAPSESAPQS